MCIHTYIYTYIHTYIGAARCKLFVLYTYVCIHTYIDIHYTHTQVYLPTYIHTHIHTHTHTHTHTHIHTYTLTHTHTHIYIQTYIHTYIHTHIHTHTHTHTHTYPHVPTHTHTHTLHTHTHTHTQTHYIQIYTYIYTARAGGSRADSGARHSIEAVAKDVGRKARMRRAEHDLPRPPAATYKSTPCDGENGVLFEVPEERFHIKVRGRLQVCVGMCGCACRHVCVCV